MSPRAWRETYGPDCRAAGRRALLELAREDERIFAVDNDLGPSGDRFGAEFPRRHLRTGTAVAAQMGIAAGLAKAGKIPFVNTYATLATTRACEQLRMDVAYRHANVKVIGYCTGLSSGHAGPVQHCAEDIAITRAIPGLTVLSPADAYETYLAVRAAAAHDGPVYVRAGRGPTPAVYDRPTEFRIGRAVLLRGGDDVTVLATGGLMVPEALRIADLLAADGVRCRVLNVHTLKPLDERAILAAARETRLLVTYEDHNVVNGLGSAVASLVAVRHPVTVLRYGVPDRFCGKTANYEDMPALYNFGAEQVAEGVRRWLTRH